MKDQWCSTSNNTRTALAPCSIAIDEELLSLITSDEAAVVTQQMSRIFLSLLALVPDDPENSLPEAQQWLFAFGGEDKLSPSGWHHLQQVIGDIDEQELRQALDWMRRRHIIELREQGASLYLTIRNVRALNAVGDGAEEDDVEN